jgi:hypothetical protein
MIVVLARAMTLGRSFRVGLICLVMTDRAAGDGPKRAMMPSEMAGDTTDNGAFDAAFGMADTGQRQQRRHC